MAVITNTAMYPKSVVHCQIKHENNGHPTIQGLTEVGLIYNCTSMDETDDLCVTSSGVSEGADAR